MKKDKFFNRLEPWAERKHRLLRKYLPCVQLNLKLEINAHLLKIKQILLPSQSDKLNLGVSFKAPSGEKSRFHRVSDD